MAGFVMLASVTACGGSTKPQQPKPATEVRPLSAAELRTHLLPAVLPGGWTSFQGDGAHQAMRDMRNLVGRCRSVDLPRASWEPAETFSFAVAEGPRLGDESLVIKATVTTSATGSQSADATVVRVGSSLVVISSVLTLTQEEADTVAAFMSVAVAQVKSNHPEPVDVVS
ncbi:hypothetical protein ACIPUC_00550 [Streptomyces sp. LARHCF249]